MTAAGSGNGFGTTSWWGFSPALDLQATYLETSTEHLHLSQDGIPELNILLVGSIDGRHILKTMCQAHRWPQRKINAKVINSRDFFRWRNTGMAFEMREASYDVPNKTLASGRLLRHKGEPISARGYWGDIATGPFIAFGIETEETSLLKTNNGLPSKNAQEISLYNLTALFYELSYRSRYNPPEASEKDGDNGSFQGHEDLTPLDALNENIRVHFLPLNCLSQLHHKGKFQHLFNLIFFSCSMVHLLKPELHLVSAPKATVLVELADFLPDLRKEQVSEFSSQVGNLARAAGFMPVETPSKEAFSLFQLGDPPETAEPGH